MTDLQQPYKNVACLGAHLKAKGKVYDFLWKGFICSFILFGMLSLIFGFIACVYWYTGREAQEYDLKFVLFVLAVSGWSGFFFMCFYTSYENIEQKLKGTEFELRGCKK